MTELILFPDSSIAARAAHALFFSRYGVMVEALVDDDKVIFKGIEVDEHVSA